MTNETLELRQELLLDKEINERLDDLVDRANNRVKQVSKSMEENQIRNLLNVAITTPSVEVVINFIRYQIARNSGSWGSDPQSFGHQIINDLRTEVSDLATEVAGKVVDDLTQPQTDEERKAAENRTDAERAAAEKEKLDKLEQLRKRAYTQLIRLYLGYLTRAFYYVKKVGDVNLPTKQR